MAKQAIGVGSAANDGTGDTIRTAFGKVNDNFTELYEQGVSQQTDNYTIAASDSVKRLEISKATAVNLTVPANGTVALPVGFITYPVRTGAGALTIVAAGGVTITSTSGALTPDPGLNVMMTLIKTGTNTWLLQNGVAVGVWGTWTPTWAGASANQTNPRYTSIGKLLVVSVAATAWGTSNAASYTMTLPSGYIAAANAAWSLSYHVDNGTVVIGGIATAAAGSNIISFFRTAAFGNWTTSGSKAIAGTFSIEVQ